jgi:hypothetical protein
MKRLENVQKRALRLVFNEKLDYSELLCKAKTCSLEVRWKRQLATEVYKAINGLTPTYISDLFVQKSVSYNLRSVSLAQPRFNTMTHGYHSLRQEGTRLWESLPNSCRSAADLKTFKTLVSKHLNA